MADIILASRKVTQTHTCTTIPASLSQHIGFIVCIVPCRSGKRPQRCGIWVSVRAELLLAMISQIAPLPSPPSVSISHGWPHSSAPLASSGASLCNAGSFWFSGLYKKVQKGKGDVQREAASIGMGVFFSSLVHEAHHSLFSVTGFLHSGWSRVIWWSRHHSEGENATEWLGEISNHRTGPADTYRPER